VYAFIFARGGSKGVPRKNIRELAGKPLIAYSIEAGRKSDLIDRIVVSTDDHEIAEIAMLYGAEVPFIRPMELSKDESPEWLAWRHAISEMKNQIDAPAMDVFTVLPTTSPLRSVNDVDACINKYLKSDVDMIITVKKASRHPSYNMVALDSNQCAQIVMPLTKKVCRRQDAPPIYDITTVAYVTNPDYIMNANDMFEGKVGTVMIPEERALDIDTEFDFSIAKFLITQNQQS